MAAKTDFSADEWNKLLESPLLAGFAISAADPSGIFGTLKEGLANAGALAEAKTSVGDSLIKSVADDLLTPDGRTAAREGVKTLIRDAGGMGGVKDKALAALAQTAAILDAKAPAEAPAFKAWLADIANRVAEAGSEGGFLGFGGEKVSDTEKATLEEISKAIGV